MNEKKFVVQSLSSSNYDEKKKNLTTKLIEKMNFFQPFSFFLYEKKSNFFSCQILIQNICPVLSFLVLKNERKNTYHYYYYCYYYFLFIRMKAGFFLVASIFDQNFPVDFYHFIIIIIISNLFSPGEKKILFKTTRTTTTTTIKKMKHLHFHRQQQKKKKELFCPQYIVGYFGYYLVSWLIGWLVG